MKKYRVILLSLVVMTIAIAIVACSQQPKKVPYPGSGVYDLTEYEPYSVSGSVSADSSGLIETVFTTNSTEISITNHGDNDIEVNLSYNDNPTYYIGFQTLAAGKTDEFGGLKAGYQYRLTVISEGSDFSLTISD